MNENFPNLNINFPDLRFMILAGFNTREQDLLQFNVELPKLKVTEIGYCEIPVGFVASFFMQQARATQIDSAIIHIYGGSNPAPPTSASDAEKNYLLGRGFYLKVPSLNATLPTQGPWDITASDALPLVRPFVTYVNERTGSSFSPLDLSIHYLIKCGSLPNFCSTPASPALTLCGRSEPVFAQIQIPPIDNCSDFTFFAVSMGTELHKAYTDSLRNNFDSTYRAKCLQAYKKETFTVTHEVSEYHYTLYYYDQAGNLVKTIAPEGVAANYDSLWLDSVSVARSARQVKVPSHRMPTQYRYNTLNQVVAQKSPDGGESRFWYERLGRLAISQNARQYYASATENNKLYRYTLYDSLGRITEVGEIKNATTTVMTDSISRSPSLLGSWIQNSVLNKSQITTTVYDQAYPGFVGITPVLITQRNLRNRISYTSITDTLSTASLSLLFNNPPIAGLEV
jgi:hypothetical protein